MTRILFILTLYLLHSICNGQAVLSSRQVIQGLEVYADLKDQNKYYYSPGQMKLFVNSEGEPDFKLIEMRYTGRAVSGDQGDSRYMNIVQLRVKIDQPSKKTLTDIKNSLGKKAILKPIPIKNVEATLVAPFKMGYKTIGAGTFQSNKPDKKAAWQERTFTVRLDNHEAQLLWDMVEGGQIAVSVAYSYYAILINDSYIDIETEGASQFSSIVDLKIRRSDSLFQSESPDSIFRSIEHDSLFKSVLQSVEDYKSADTLLSTYMIMADAFGLEVDIAAFPDVLKKIDLNSGVPPAYPVMQVACYDFYNDLRPDLDMKTIEFEAIDLNDRTTRVKAIKFISSDQDIHTKQIRFPNAVNMERPLRYRIKEYSNTDGLKEDGWKTIVSWSGILDITSREVDIAFERRFIEIELDNSDMNKAGVTQTYVVLEYYYGDKLYESRVSFSSEEKVPIKQLSLLCDKGSQVKYSVVKNRGAKRALSLKKIIAEDDYVYIDFTKP